eukprot:gene22548-28681_t
MYIQAAFPCTATDRTDDGATDVELDPEADWLLRQSIEEMGMCVVGWYHSHPTFKPVPSVTDINNQFMYQNAMQESQQPFVGLIVSSFDSMLASNEADHQWFCVAPYKPEGVKSVIQLPMVLAVTYLSMQCTSSEWIGEGDLYSDSVRPQQILDAIDGMTYVPTVEVMLPPLPPKPVKTESEPYAGSGKGRKRKAGAAAESVGGKTKKAKGGVKPAFRPPLGESDDEGALSDDSRTKTKRIKTKKTKGAAAKKKAVAKNGKSKGDGKKGANENVADELLDIISDAVVVKTDSGRARKQPSLEFPAPVIEKTAPATATGSTRPSRSRGKPVEEQIEQVESPSEQIAPPVTVVNSPAPSKSRARTARDKDKTVDIDANLVQDSNATCDADLLSSSSSAVQARETLPELDQLAQSIPLVHKKTENTHQTNDAEKEAHVVYKSISVATEGGSKKTVTLTASSRPVRKSLPNRNFIESNDEATKKTSSKKSCRLTALSNVVSAAEEDEAVASQVEASTARGSRRVKANAVVEPVLTAVPVSQADKKKSQAAVVPAVRVSLRAVERSSRQEFEAQQQQQQQQQKKNEEESVGAQVFCMPVKRKYTKKVPDEDTLCVLNENCGHAKGSRGKRGAKTTASIVLSKKTVTRRPSPQAAANALLYGSIVLSMQDQEHHSARLGRQLISRVRPAFRLAVMSVVVMGLYYCRSARRAPLTKKWVRNGHDDIVMFDKIRVSVTPWAERLGLIHTRGALSASAVTDDVNVKGEEVATSSPVLDLLMDFLVACWSDHSKATAAKKAFNCKHEYL